MQQWGVGCLRKALGRVGEEKWSVLSCLQDPRLPGHTIALGLVQGKRWGRCCWVVTRGRSGGDDTGEERAGPPPRPQADFPRPQVSRFDGLTSHQLDRRRLGLGWHH